MAPRRYAQGRRAESAAATRRRIVDAAAEVYREHGVSKATIQAIAERADVARGTVLNHFGGTDGVLEAVLDRAVEEVEYPSERDLAGAVTPDDRVRRFVEVMFRFFERSATWWSVFAADMELAPLKAREHAYWEVVARFHRAAFGELAGDRVVTAAVRAFVDYRPLNALREAGLTLDEAIEVVSNALIDAAGRHTAESTATEGRDG